MDYNLLVTFLLLVSLELVLGIDNILLISIVTDRVAPENQRRVRWLGLGMALGARLLLLMGASYLVQLNEPVLGIFSCLLASTLRPPDELSNKFAPATTPSGNAQAAANPLNNAAKSLRLCRAGIAVIDELLSLRRTSCAHIFHLALVL